MITLKMIVITQFHRFAAGFSNIVGTNYPITLPGYLLSLPLILLFILQTNIIWVIRLPLNYNF